MITDYFLKQMQHGRIRQLAISAVSIVLAGACVAFFSVSEFGGFGYYTIIILLVINAVLALMQFQQVLRPIEKIIAHLTDVAARVESGDLRSIERLSKAQNDAFGCLAESMDGIIEKLITNVTSLREASKSQEEMLLALPFAVLIATHDGTIAKFLNANGLGRNIRGFRLGEKPSAAFWGEKNLKQMNDALARAVASSETVWCDLLVTRPEDGRDEPFRLTMRRLDGMSILVTLLNVSDRPEIAAADGGAGRNEKKVESASETRARLRHMAASIAHDIKNIFAALNNLVTLNRASSDANVREQTLIADDAIRRGTTLLSELQTFAGETRFNLTCQPAGEAFETLTNSPALKALLPPQVQLMVSISDKPMPEVDVDSDQAWKVFLNLVKNAVEAMNGNAGRILIKIEPHMLTAEETSSFRSAAALRPGAGVLLTFTDDGPGIPEDIRARMFDPYYSSKGEGRGIGLATVCAIVDAHGAGIAVKSSPGSGTTFTIFLPASRNTARELAMVREAAPNGEILLVDDDPTILHTTGLVLRALKVAAHPASTEEDALAKLRSLRGRIRLALVDANINSATSVGLVRRMHVEYPELPIVIVSGSPRESIDKIFADVPYDRFLAKPYAVTDLSTILNEFPLKQ